MDANTPTPRYHMKHLLHCVSVEPLDSDQLMDVRYNTVRGSLSIAPDVNFDPRTPPGLKDAAARCFLVFDGVGLTEDGLKDWLRLCAKQVDVCHAERQRCAEDRKCLNAVFSVCCLQRQTKKPRKTKNTLSPQEIKHIHVSLALIT